jgi:hypothetical protein
MKTNTQQWVIIKQLPWIQNGIVDSRHLGTIIWSVSDHGNVKREYFNLNNELVKSRQVNQHWKGRTKKYLAIPTGAYTHRLVAQHFIPNPEGCTNVTFKDDDVTNVCADNLMWTNARKR